jgi:hypothetical protein
VRAAQLEQPLLVGETRRQPRIDRRQQEHVRQLPTVLSQQHRCLVVRRHRQHRPPRPPGQALADPA